MRRARGGAGTRRPRASRCPPRAPSWRRPPPARAMSPRAEPKRVAEPKPGQPVSPRRRRLVARLRNHFLTGLVIVGPVILTIYLTLWFVGLADAWVKPFIPDRYNPDSYLPF